MYRLNGVALLLLVSALYTHEITETVLLLMTSFLLIIMCLNLVSNIQHKAKMENHVTYFDYFGPVFAQEG